MKFTRKQKQLANYSKQELQKVYSETEKALRHAAKNRDRKGMDRAMSLHHDVEYALLFKDMKEG